MCLPWATTIGRRSRKAPSAVYDEFDPVAIWRLFRFHVRPSGVPPVVGVAATDGGCGP
jgi:hypothetical protein